MSVSIRLLVIVLSVWTFLWSGLGIYLIFGSMANVGLTICNMLGGILGGFAAIKEHQLAAFFGAGFLIVSGLWLFVLACIMIAMDSSPLLAGYIIYSLMFFEGIVQCASAGIFVIFGLQLGREISNEQTSSEV